VKLDAARREQLARREQVLGLGTATLRHDRSMLEQEHGVFAASRQTFGEQPLLERDDAGVRPLAEPDAPQGAR
jgi:hypothetical protein